MPTHSDRTRLIASATRRGEGRRPVNPPLERASTMLSDAAAVMRDETEGPTYGLSGTNAARQLRRALADLEGADEAFLVPSGLAAVTVPLLALLRPGDEVVTTDALYGPTRRFLSRYQAARDVTTRFLPADADAATIIAAVGDRTRLVLMESPASLTFDMVDAAAVAASCRARGVLTIMDNTWAAGEAFLDALTLFGLGYSWGGFESLITHETHQMAYRAHPPKLEGELIRLHIGLEDPADLIADLEVGLGAFRAALTLP